MSNLTTEQMMLINNLVYLDRFDDANNSFIRDDNEGMSVGDYVDRILSNPDCLKDDANYDYGMTGAEIRQTLNAIKNDPVLCDYVIKSANDGSNMPRNGKSVVLVNDSTHDAVVAFKGTEGNQEWVDNMNGLYQDPTADQQAAYDWFKSEAADLDGYDITVTGHSKGGNKAKYITIMDEEGLVDNCVSFDGQGFSDEFMENHSDLIAANQDKIHNVCAESDFVNLLLNDVGSKQYYEGSNYGSLGFGENHSPNCPFFFDDNGNLYLKPADGQDPTMEQLDEILNSFIRSCPSEERENLANMMGELIVGAMGKDPDAVIAALTDEKYKDSASDLLAYVLKYKQDHPEFMDGLEKILTGNGIDPMIVKIADVITNNDLLMKLIAEHPDQVMWALNKLGLLDDDMMAYLKAHPEIFALLLDSIGKMKDVDTSKYDGKDIVIPSTAGRAQNGGMAGSNTTFFIDVAKVRAYIAVLEECRAKLIKDLADLNEVIAGLDFTIRVLVEFSLIGIRVKMILEIAQLSKFISALTQICNLYEAAENAILQAMGH